MLEQENQKEARREIWKDTEKERGVSSSENREERTLTAIFPNLHLDELKNSQ